MATTVVIPAVRRGDVGPDRRRAFHAVESRSAWQARTAVILVGATGLYMAAKLELWDRFSDVAFWWMHAMVCLWLIFTVLLFLGEPLVLHHRFSKWAAERPEAAFTWLHRAHVVLLALSLITVFGAVAGSHGWSIL